MLHPANIVSVVEDGLAEGGGFGKDGGFEEPREKLEVAEPGRNEPSEVDLALLHGTDKGALTLQREASEKEATLDHVGHLEMEQNTDREIAAEGSNVAAAVRADTAPRLGSNSP